MEMEKSAVQSLWVQEQKEIPQLQRLCIESFLEQGTEYFLYTYDDVGGLPDGVVLRDANAIIPKESIFLDQFNSYATFADWFRIKLLHEMGGWWADTDVVCLREFVSAEEYVFATEWSRDNPVICNCVMKTPKKGRIEKLSGVPHGDSIFLSRVNLDTIAPHRNIRLSTGMLGTAEIITEDASLLQRLLRNLRLVMEQRN